MTQLTQDEYGYINNKGASKYWGVTTSMVQNKRTWVVTFRPSWSEQTLGARSEGGNIQERDAATVAAWLYENLEDASLKDVTIRLRSRLNSRRILCFVPSQGRIWIEAYRNQTLNELLADSQPPKHWTQVLGELHQADFFEKKEEEPEEERQVEEAFKVFEESEEKVKSLCERNLIAMVQNAILEDNISPKAAKLMIASLETVLD